MEKIPIYIELDPHRIRDSIVQVFFTSDIPYIPSIGYFYSYLVDEGFDYVPQSQNSNSSSNSDSLNNEISIALNHLFVNNNEGVKLVVHPNNSIIFNTVDSYIGWEKYFEIIQNVINLLHSNGIVNSFYRVGIRYTTEFHELDILEKIRFDYDLASEDSGAIQNGQFRFEWNNEDHKIVLNLAANVNSGIVKDDRTALMISLIDVDVIRSDIHLETPEEVFTEIATTKLKQKATFFRLLKDEFIEELKPKYDS